MVGLAEINETMANVILGSSVNGDPLPKVLDQLVGQYGFDPEAVQQMAGQIVQAAVMMNQPPEEAVGGAFCTGILIGAMLGEKP